MTFRPSIFDRALLAVAPVSGLRRLHARAAAAEFLRAYDGASRDRRLKNWRADASGPRAEGDSARELLRYRARDLERNNKTVRSAKLQFQGQTVGAGITPRAVGANKTLRKKANEAWKRFVDTCDMDGQQDYYGLLSMTAGAMFIDGEALHHWVDAGNRKWAKIRVLEVDHLDETRTGLLNGGTDFTADGIKFDINGQRRGYWIYETHPGENNLLTRKPSLSRLVAADDIDHFFHVGRPGQIRGISWLAPSIISLRGLDDVTEAIIWRKRIEACLSLIIRSPEAQGAAPVIGAQSTDDKGRREEAMAPGKMVRLGPGEDVTPFTPSTSGDTIEFMRMQLYAFCATAGLAYHEVTGDASQANYSSMRAAKIAGYALMDMVQWLTLAPRIKSAWRRVMAAEWAASGVDLRAVSCELAMPVRPWVDPLKDIMAKVLEIRAGLQAHPDALAERGINSEDFVPEVENWLKLVDASGLIFDTDPRKVNDSGALQAATKAQASSAGGADAQATN
ncbi:MAG: phage portal protein [Alphaproteobacteria bacterium]|nr:phage portal protein [Alphaproteobacteria bacterium]MBM3653970.1 phage portal protein [Alphaproteobacteria bacterium]